MMMIKAVQHYPLNYFSVGNKPMSFSVGEISFLAEGYSKAELREVCHRNPKVSFS